MGCTDSQPVAKKRTHSFNEKPHQKERKPNEVKESPLEITRPRTHHSLHQSLSGADNPAKGRSKSRKKGVDQG